MTDARNLSDRELLLLVNERVERIHEVVFGPPSLTSRLDVVETRVAERTTAASKKSVAGISAVVTGVLLGVAEALRRLGQ